MRIFIRTTGERSIEQFKDLDADILLDKEKTGCKGYFEQMKYLATIDDDILLLEDDIILRKEFFVCLNSLIAISKNDYIINMSQCCNTVKLLHPDHFKWTRAVYYPKGSIANFMKNYTEEHLKICQWYDLIQRELMSKGFIGVPSMMNIIDLNLPSIMPYKK